MKRPSKNYREGKVPPVQTEYDGFAFSFKRPRMVDGNPIGRRIFPGYDGEPMTFINCNLVNARPPRGSILIDCNTTIVEFKRLRAGFVEGPNAEYENVIHGRTNRKTLEPDYRMKDGVKSPYRKPLLKRHR